MTPFYVPGGWYCAATKDAYAALRPVQGDPAQGEIATSQGRIALPGQNILYLDCTVLGTQLCIAGSGHVDDGAFLWNGDWLRVYEGRPYGTSPCIFGPLGLYVSIEGAVDNILVFDPRSGALLHKITKAVGARGIAAVTGSGERPDDIQSQDGWYGRGGFAEYIELEDGLRVGQGAAGGLCACERDGALVMLEPGDNQFVRGHLDGTTITVSAWQRDRARAAIVRLERAELLSLAPVPVDIPAINRPLWLGFFMFADGPAAPGNCTLAIRHVSGRQALPVIVSDETVATVTGQALGYWCAAKPGETLKDVEDRAMRAAQQGYRPVAYWDARTWPRRPVLPVGSWCCVQAYCGVTEGVPAFNANIREAVAITARYGYDLALVTQCYTNRDDFTKDLSSLVPVFAGIARDLSPIVAMLPFSGAGRATGLQDQPSLIRSLWDQVAAGISVPPQESLDMPVRPTITVRSFAKVLEAGKGTTLLDLHIGDTDIQIEKDANDNLKVHAKNSAGEDQTGAPRHVAIVGPNAPSPPTPTPTPQPSPQPIPSPVAKTTSLKTFHGTFLNVGPGSRLRAGTVEKPFEVVKVPGGYALKPDNGNYVAAEQDGTLVANRITVGAWETFSKDKSGDDARPRGFSLKSWQGKYVAVEADGTVIANRDSASTFETFEGDVSDAVAVTQPLTADGRIFRLAGEPWRWKGVSAFPLLDRFAKGEDIQPFLEAFVGFNLLRVWNYVTWPGTGWDSQPPDVVETFLELCAAAGFYVELTLLTDDDAGRITQARTLALWLAASHPPNLLLEIGNEPTTHKNIDTPALKAACEASGFLYSSGDYEDSARFFGKFLTAHTPRDSEWPRKAHDLLEYFTGGGPSAPSDPAHKVPCVADEPQRPDQAGFNVQDFRAYFATCALLGAGATFHYEGGKFGRLPTPDEARCAEAALQGLDAFPADAQNGGYRRIDEQGKSLRTYVVGERCMVRVRPTVKDAPEPGWTAIDTDGILWKR